MVLGQNQGLDNPHKWELCDFRCLIQPVESVWCQLQPVSLMSHLEVIKACLFTASNVLDWFCKPGDNKRKEEGVQDGKCVSDSPNVIIWRTCIYARRLSRGGRLWSRTVWRSSACEPSVLFGTGQCPQNSALCTAFPPLQGKKKDNRISVKPPRFSLYSWYGIRFTGANTLLFLFPTIIAKVRNIIILYSLLQVL